MVTLEQIKEQHEKTAAMIASYEAVANAKSAYPVTLAYPELKDGEVFIGTIINANGKGYHLILLPGEAEGKTWADAKEWAVSVDGVLPDRVDSALMYARAKGEFKEAWYWTSEQLSGDSDYAWMQDFSNGYQYCHLKSYEYRCRAVRRLPI